MRLADISDPVRLCPGAVRRLHTSAPRISSGAARSSGRLAVKRSLCLLLPGDNHGCHPSAEPVARLVSSTARTVTLLEFGPICNLDARLENGPVSCSGVSSPAINVGSSKNPPSEPTLSFSPNAAFMVNAFSRGAKLRPCERVASITAFSWSPIVANGVSASSCVTCTPALLMEGRDLIAASAPAFCRLQPQSYLIVPVLFPY